MKTALVIGCSVTLHHATTIDPIPGVREKQGDYTYRLAELFPEVNWYNFGKGASSNFEYLRRITNFIEHFGRPNFILIQVTYAERTLLEFHNYKQIELETETIGRGNYHAVFEKNIRENAAYISGYNFYCSYLPAKMISCLKDAFALHLTSTFHALRFWETFFLLQSYLNKIQMPHLFFLTHHPKHLPDPPRSLPIDFSTTLESGQVSLYQWFEKNFGPYENFLISEEDHHLTLDYNRVVAERFLAPEITSLLKRL